MRGTSRAQQGAAFGRVRERGFEEAADRIDIFRGYGGAGGEHEHAAAQELSVGEQQAGVREIAAIGLHAVATGVKIAASQDIFSFEDLDNFIAADTGLRFVDFKDNVLIVAALIVLE